MASPAVMRQATPQATPQAVMAHVRRLSDADPDFRFMSLNDLLQLLASSKPDFLLHEYNIAARAVDSIIKTLDDQNSEVQNLAIKCLGPLVGRVPSSILSPMLDKLSSLKLKNSVDSTVPSLALRAVITALPHPVPGTPTPPEVKYAYDAIQRVLIPRLIGPGPMTQVPDASIQLPPVPLGLLQDKDSINAEAVDVLIELVRCFGPILQPIEVEAILQVVLQLLESAQGTSVVKKRAVVAISMLALHLEDDQLGQVIERITVGLSRTDTSSVAERLYFAILGSMARSIPARFGPHLPRAAPLVLRALSEEILEQHMERINDGEDLTRDFNDVREAAMVSLEAFMISCPQEMCSFTDEILSSSLRYLKYDPNYALDNGEGMEVDVSDEDAGDKDDVFDDDDGFDDDDDDDDASWKVRRCAAKVIYTLIATRAKGGDLLDNGLLYSQLAPALIRRMDEREENVRLEVISTLALLIRKTEEGPNAADLRADELEVEAEAIGQVPPSRKRRRQSSGGSATAWRLASGSGPISPTVDKMSSVGPRADLCRLIPSIVKAATKQLQGRTVATKQAVINLLDDLVTVQRGGLSDFLPDLVEPVTEEVLASSAGTSSSLSTAGGSASATPSTLRIAALRLISDTCRSHMSTTLQPYLSTVVAAVTSAVHDRFYKISSEALRAAEELVKTLTSPRLENAVEGELRQALDKLYEVIIERGSANDADAEVRQRAIHALGVLVSRTSAANGSSLLSPEKRKAALDVLRDRLKNETTRLAAVRAIDKVAAHLTVPSQLDDIWVQNVALELASQLRKANRSLRASSIVALKHLVLSGACKDRLKPATIQGIVMALMPAILNSDTHLLGPALVILAKMAEGDPDPVIGGEMIGALCQLLKSHFAGIVLEPLLELMSQAGRGKAAEQLMQGLLKEVSVSGDPLVVGKVMGTLVVTGGDRTGVTLESFVSELRNSSQSGDEARVSLALAVLGEAGMRLGAQSPLKADLFLEQFRTEPDKVSLAAAVALGRAGSGNVAQFLPVILKTMQNGGHRQYLLIQSVKEILQSVAVQPPDLSDYVRPIWDQLLEASKLADNRVVCAECVGRLVILDPATFMPRLETLLKDRSPEIRGMAVQAVRYTLPESDEIFDAMLKTTLIDMLLVMLQDSDTEIRRLAMSTLNSAARNKADLILPHLNELVPLVLSESVMKPELVKEVMLGPFRHTVDDGLEVRKSAYETLYALMETAFSRMNNVDFYDRVVAGLRDDNDIRQLCNLMVTKLMVIDADETARRLDAIAEAYRTVLSMKLKENAVKQDVEKQEEANKSVLRVTLLLGDRMKTMREGGLGATMGLATGWATYWEWVTKEFDKQLKGLREETRELQTKML